MVIEQPAKLDRHLGGHIGLQKYHTTWRILIGLRGSEEWATTFLTLAEI